MHTIHSYNCNDRSTPVECLHTKLMGPYKYLFKELMGEITASQKKEISAYIDDSPASGLKIKLSSNAPKYV